MRKHILKKTFLIISAVMFCLSFAIAAFPQAKVKADQQNNVLLLIGKHCHDLKDLEHDFGVGVGDKDNPDSFASRCDWGNKSNPDWQQIVQDNLDCAKSGMYYTRDKQTDPGDSSVTEKRWYTKEGAYKACYNKAEAKYNFIAKDDSVCKKMKRGSGNWNACEDAQDQLHNALGCDSGLFQTIDDGYWGIKPNALNLCKTQIANVGNVNIVIIGPDGNPITNTKPISDPSVVAEGDPEGDAAGDGESSCGSGLSLGWIICPIVETVSEFGQFAFNEIIQPLMEETPLSTDTTDPIYRSWQGFRFIANSLLIVSLLALVYSQAKGGD